MPKTEPSLVKGLRGELSPCPMHYFFLPTSLLPKATSDDGGMPRGDDVSIKHKTFGKEAAAAAVIDEAPVKLVSEKEMNFLQILDISMNPRIKLHPQEEVNVGFGNPQSR